MCYVDDPSAAMGGTKADKRLHASTSMLVWEALGFGLAYPKGQLEDEVAWIGGAITVEAGGVRVKIKESIVSDICDDLRRITSNNVATLKELRSLIGKFGHTASLLIIMRPFMEPCGQLCTTHLTPRHLPTRFGRV